jgi:glycogen operon protein
MDSLRYWVTEMHVDGFRFDLASALARELRDVNKLGAFFDTIYQDPTLATIKLIAEPWDLGGDGYQVGNFPVGWTEWNGKFRDSVRKFWKGEMGLLAELAKRLSASADLYEHNGRLPSAGINFVTAHDGFTLHDLVTYEQKHNEANKDDNKDGADDNESWNCGVEGETEDEGIIALREQQKRNLWCTLIFSQGVPMISGGDEISRTQGGNNNGYCQDNEISWHSWELDERRMAFLDFAARTVRFRRAHPNFHRRVFYDSDPAAIHADGDTVKWLRSDGEHISDEDWKNGGWIRAFGMYLPGEAPEIRGPNGEVTTDKSFLILLNGHSEGVDFRLGYPETKTWKVVFDTSRPDLKEESEIFESGGAFRLAGRSFALLSHE